MLSPRDHVRVVLGEDDGLLREALPLMLERHGFDVACVARDAACLVERSCELRPDLVVSDLGAPPADPEEGPRAAVRLHRILPETAIAVVAASISQRHVWDLFGDGGGSQGVGYIARQQIDDADTFCADLRRIAAGETILPPHAVGPVPARRSDGPGLEQLTERQHQVLSAMAEGHSNAAIARQLGISAKAVVQHVSHIYEHLGLEVTEDSHRRVRAVLRYLEDER